MNEQHDSVTLIISGGFFMPKNKFQDVIFTIIMVFVMVYVMICYNIALNIGGMKNEVFLSAFHELVIMGPLAFILDFFLVGPFAKKKAFSIINPERDNPFMIVLAISVVSIIGMCPLMSLAATLLFKNAGSQFIAVWLETTALNFPMAFFGSFALPVHLSERYSDSYSEKSDFFFIFCFARSSLKNCFIIRLHSSSKTLVFTSAW